MKCTTCVEHNLRDSINKWKAKDYNYIPKAPNVTSPQLTQYTSKTVALQWLKRLITMLGQI